MGSFPKGIEYTHHAYDEKKNQHICYHFGGPPKISIAPVYKANATTPAKTMSKVLIDAETKPPIINAIITAFAISRKVFAVCSFCSLFTI